MGVGIIKHYNEGIGTVMASQITSLKNVYSFVYLGTDERKHRSGEFTVNFPHKRSVTWKMFPFDGVIMV